MNQDISEELKALAQSIDDISADFFERKIKGSSKYGHAMQIAYRALQKIEWKLDPRKQGWETPTGNIWCWNENGMFLNNYGQNFTDLRPSRMNVDEINDQSK